MVSSRADRSSEMISVKSVPPLRLPPSSSRLKAERNFRFAQWGADGSSILVSSSFFSEVRTICRSICPVSTARIFAFLYKTSGSSIVVLNEYKSTASQQSVNPSIRHDMKTGMLDPQKGQNRLTDLARSPIPFECGGHCLTERTVSLLSSKRAKLRRIHHPSIREYFFHPVAGQTGGCFSQCGNCIHKACSQSQQAMWQRDGDSRRLHQVNRRAK